MPKSNDWWRALSTLRVSNVRNPKGIAAAHFISVSVGRAVMFFAYRECLAVKLQGKLKGEFTLKIADTYADSELTAVFLQTWLSRHAHGIKVEEIPQWVKVNKVQIVPWDDLNKERLT